MIYQFPSHTPKLSEMIEYGMKLLQNHDHIQDAVDQFEKKYPGRLYVLEYCLESRSVREEQVREEQKNV